MTLNGWHRLLIVLATAWAMGVIGFATLEYHGRQGEIGDGFFTCWEPYGSSPSAPVGKQSCGILAREEISPGAFGSVLPGIRYLNTTRSSAVLIGPIAFVGLWIIAICWIVRGFGLSASRRGRSETNLARRPLLSDRPELPPQSHAEAWLDRLPRRWGRNAAIGGGVLAALSTMPFLSGGDGTFVVFMLVGFAVVTLGIAGAGYFCGRWARYSLRASLMMNPTAAIARITSTWLTGAILLGALVLACDLLLGWRKTAPLFEGGVGFRDWGYLIGFFGTWTLGGYLTALVSRRGLRKAIDADRKSSSARPRPPAPHSGSLQGEYSIG